MSIAVTKGKVHVFVERAYGLRLIHPLVALPQGVHSQAWLACTDDGDWVVKISDPRSDSPATLSAQCELYDFLSRRGLSAPVVRADRSGQRVSSITGSEDRYPVTLMRHHRLRRLAPQSVSADDLRHVATQIARLHTTMEELPKKDDIIAQHEKALNEWGKQAAGCYQDLMESPTAAYFAASERSWLEAIDTATVAYLDDHFPDPTSLSQVILHGDLSFEHVRFLSNRDVYFFDFGDMSWGPVAHDLALFLRSFRDSPISFERWADLRSWLLEGYRATRVCTAKDEAAIDVFLLNRVVAQAKYILELNGDEASANGAAAIKRSYRLAEVVLRNGHFAVDQSR